MGDLFLPTLNELRETGRALRAPVPLSRPVEATLGELHRFTPTIEALAVPDIDSSLDEQSEKTRFWNAFKPVGSWWAELPPY